MTSKQESVFEKSCNGYGSDFQVGKSSMTPELTNAIAEALTARELIKIMYFKTVPMIRKKLHRSWQNVPAPRLFR